MASLSWAKNINRVQAKGVSTAMLMLSRSHRLGCHLLLGGVLFVGSLNAAAVGKTTPSYTTDLSPWRPHGENSLKASITEPRFMALQEAEMSKVVSCIGAQYYASTTMSQVAMAEAGIDIRAKHGGSARDRPVGELAEKEFRDEVELALRRFGEGRWPSRVNQHGSEVATVYGHHFGYQFWQEEYKSILANPLSTDMSLGIEVSEQFWSLCLEQVPTACFEEGPADPKRCLSKLIHPREFPAYEVTSDLFQKYMAKPNAW